MTPPNPISLFSTARILTPIQQSALELYQLGMNILPQPYGRKKGFPHKLLQNTRLHYDPYSMHDADLFSVMQGRCNLAVMTGRTSRNLFVIDCETQQSLGHMIEQLRRRRIPLWVVVSPSPKAGGHIYLFCEDGEVTNIATGLHRDLEVRGNRLYVLAPPSVRFDAREGVSPIYQWQFRDGNEPPTLSIADVEGLTDLDGTLINISLCRTSRAKKPVFQLWQPISRKTQDYLDNGHRIAEGARHQSLFNAACDYARCDVAYREGYQDFRGHDIATARRILSPIARASGLPAHEIEHVITQAYGYCTKATYKAKWYRNQAAVWQPAIAFAHFHHWKGRTGSTDKAVFLALIERARAYANQNGTFRATERELAELARVESRTTIRRALKRLRTSSPPLICWAGEDKNTASQKNARNGKKGGASLWRFSDYVVREGQRGKSDPIWNNPYGLSSSGSLLPATDAAEPNALGFLGLHIYQTLLTFDHPATVKQIAERANLTADQVRYRLVGRAKYGSKLQLWGLVRRVDNSFVAMPATEAQLDDMVARPAGTLGNAQKRHQKYAIERALYAGVIIMAARHRWDRSNLFADDFLLNSTINAHNANYLLVKQETENLVQDQSGRAA